MSRLNYNDCFYLCCVKVMSAVGKYVLKYGTTRENCIWVGRGVVVVQIGKKKEKKERLEFLCIMYVVVQIEKKKKREA